MTKAKRLFSSVISCLLLICTLFAAPLTASAATYSSGTSTQTITVTTEANWGKPGSESITLSQTKGTRTKKTYSWGKWKTKTSKAYGTWKVSVKATDGSHTFSKKLTGSSLKLNLKPNKTYKITVSWDGATETVNAVSKGNFTSYPTWRVKSTWKVSNYY